MKKIHFKIIGLVLFCLIVLGVFMSFISIFELRTLGEKNIGTLDTKLREDFDLMAQSQVESAMGIIQHLYEMRDERGEDAVKEIARQVIGSMRYGEDGYVFVYNSKGDTIAMLGGDLEGTNRWDLQDANGTYLIRDLVQAGKDGTGFTNYWYAKPGESESSPKRSYNQYFASWDWIVGTGNYIDDIDAIVEQEEEKTNATVFRTILIIVFSDLGVMLAAIILSWFIGKKISRPVEYLAVEARKVASGDLTVDIQVNTSDETGDLAQAFNEMIDRFNSILNGIIQTAEEINQNSNEVSTASQEVASGASEQASSAEEISASMEELSANIQQNTDNSRQSNDIVSQAAEDAFTGGKAVEETVESMKFISEKINIIEDIARNTNMLALNAAIEAARAGEAGKGFAVVASEVRKLAEHSQVAANDITQISSEGVKKADYTKELMNNMVPAIRKSAEIAEEIMEGSNEQAKGALQINAALLEMDKVIQSNAASSEEIAAMAEQLKKKSDDLNGMVSYFSIKGGAVKKKTAALAEPEELTRETAVLEVVPKTAPRRQLEDDEFTDF